MSVQVKPKTKKQFIAPKLTRFGKLERITMASGNHSDGLSFGGNWNGFGSGY